MKTKEPLSSSFDPMLFLIKIIKIIIAIFLNTQDWVLIIRPYDEQRGIVPSRRQQPVLFIVKVDWGLTCCSYEGCPEKYILSSLHIR